MRKRSLRAVMLLPMFGKLKSYKLKVINSKGFTFKFQGFLTKSSYLF